MRVVLQVLLLPTEGRPLSAANRGDAASDADASRCDAAGRPDDEDDETCNTRPEFLFLLWETDHRSFLW